MLHSRPVVLIILIVTFDLHLCDRCSQRTVLKLDFIHFGRQSALGEWPWHAAVFHQINSAHPSYACGGTIVSRTFIITAAHCTYPAPRIRPLQASEILVRVGISNIRQLEDTFQEMMITNIFRHEDYNTNTSYNDIALLQLVAELKFTDYVNSICLWRGNDEEDEIVGKEGYVPGWGQEENNLIPDILKLAVMPVVSRQACQESDPIYYTRYLFDRRTFCAGYRNGTSVGPGDSGSGLYIQINKEWLLRGIVSNGKRKSATHGIDTKNYIVFTDVAYYIKWIRTIINSLDAGGLDTIHVEEYSVCGEKTESPYYRTGLEDTRTWPWEAYIYKYNSRSQIAEIISEYFLITTGIGIPGVHQNLPPGTIRAVIESDQSVEMASSQIDRIFQNSLPEGVYCILLWKMKTPLTFTRFIRPICLFREVPYNEKTKQLTASTSQGEVILDNNICTEVFFMEMWTMGNYSFCYKYQGFSIRGFTYIKRDNIQYLYGIPSIIKPYNESATDKYVLAHYISHYKDWIDSYILDARMNVLEIENCSPIEQFVYKLFNNNRFRCYATQITPGILITTAVCVDNQLSRNLYVHSANGPVVIDNVGLHPFYDRKNLTSNIALVQYCPSTTNASICIPRFPGKIANMSIPTWPPTIIAESNSQNFTLIDTELCAQIWNRAGVNVATDGSYICGTILIADFVRHNSCTGSLHGMPLLYSTPDAPGTFLRGILDIGRQDYCKDDGLPDVYIDVTYYAQWIVEQVMNMTEWCKNKKTFSFRKKLSSIFRG